MTITQIEATSANYYKKIILSGYVQLSIKMFSQRTGNV